ncbi:MAG: DHH family phosphoesterase [Christensenellales bacterium]
MDIQKLKTALQKATARGRVALIGHDAPDVDSVVSCVLMAALCAAWQIPAEIILPTQADEQTRRVMPKFGVHPDALMKPTRPDDQLVLLDHHQALHEGEVCACIDHHPTAYPPEGDFVCIEPVGVRAAGHAADGSGGDGTDERAAEAGRAGDVSGYDCASQQQNFHRRAPLGARRGRAAGHG